jgi:hypothetical protein
MLQENFIYNRDLMEILTKILKDDEESLTTFYATIFNKLHINLKSIHVDNLKVAEQ